MVVVIAAPVKSLFLTLNFGHTAGWSSLRRPNSEQIREQLLHGRDNGGHLGHGEVTVSKVLTHSGPGPATLLWADLSENNYRGTEPSRT